MNWTRWVVAIVSLAMLAAVVTWEWTRDTSPGPLHPSHASVQALQGSAGCAACHGKGNQTMVQACFRCHEDVQAQVKEQVGIHGSVEQRERACAVCHIEHSGKVLALVSDRIFRLAKVEDPAHFDHSRFRAYKLNGKHDELACERCHPAAADASLPEHTSRFLGLTQSCVACHKDIHNGTFGNDCLSCHGQTLAFKQADGFVHTKDFPLAGGHTGLTCKDCHSDAGPTSVGSLVLRPLAPRTCEACHASPHSPTLVAAISQPANVGSACTECHRAEDRSFLYPTARLSPAQHAATGFELLGPHQQMDCERCHNGIGKWPALGKPSDLRAEFVKRFPVHETTACGECHTSPHRNELIDQVMSTKQVPVAQTCVACHSTADATFQFPPATMTPAQHAATGFDLNVPHEKAACVACHSQLGQPIPPNLDLRTDFARRFPGRSSSTCETCHADPHGGQFLKQPTNNHCLDCHSETRFAPSTFDVAAHDKTRMPLTGSHRAVACAQCHPTTNHVERFIDTPMTCVSCHKDVHAGVFDLPDRPKLIAASAGCARCHTTTAFDDVKWTADDHRRWTGYSLVGTHETASCSACHESAAKPDADHRAFGHAPTSCSACHQDIHEGQFARDGATDCSRCHSEKEKFTQTSFDHQRDSSFKLDATHLSLACAACHRPATSDGVIRYRPLGTACQDCHGTGIPERGEAK